MCDIKAQLSKGSLVLVLIALAAMQTMATTQAAETCPVAPLAPPAELVGWSQMAPITAGSDAEAAIALPIGLGAVATLLPTPAIRYAFRPEKPGGSVSHGGIFAFSVEAAGRYRVAIGSAAWVDVVLGTDALTSVAHGAGPVCTGIRKMVDFDLQPGRYLLQIAGNGTVQLPLMVTKLPK
ncbi:conserved hypothetical protein [Methylorubrum populi BJ001]|jgi:hypothetical protein|uniref:Homogentisate 1,2-dioxygenase n=4 Tax=Methylorubrum TaxID=2282523 RepID=B1Z8G2_METPB|nr:conserved hypothetical protein [Methylorubrum populi BJ001]GJE82470.1 hypothetical protein CJNNKLLH_3835 [Methylorubrum thiocyanatum]